MPQYAYERIEPRHQVVRSETVSVGIVEISHAAHHRLKDIIAPRDEAVVKANTTSARAALNDKLIGGSSSSLMW